MITGEDNEVEIDKNFSEQSGFIICDISIPIKNGYEVLEAIAVHIKEKKIPFIFLTASAQQRDIAKSKVSAADAYMMKPFQIDNLLQIISDLLKK